MNEIAEKLGKTPTQVLLRWGLQHGSSVLPKSVNPQHLKVHRPMTVSLAPDRPCLLLDT